jgi:hypothetical protein
VALIIYPNTKFEMLSYNDPLLFGTYRKAKYIFYIEINRIYLRIAKKCNEKFCLVGCHACSVEEVYQRFGGIYRVHLQSRRVNQLARSELLYACFCPENKGTIFLRNFSNSIPDYKRYSPANSTHINCCCENSDSYKTNKLAKLPYSPGSLQKDDETELFTKHSAVSTYVKLL